jgi:hypothetical protein
MPGAAVADRLIAHAVLLACEGQGCESGRLEVDDRAGEEIQGARTDPQGEVAKAKQVVRGFVGDAQILAWTEQEIKAENQTVGNRTRRGGMLLFRKGNRLCEEGQRQRLDASRWFVAFSPGLI